MRGMQGALRAAAGLLVGLMGCVDLGPQHALACGSDAFTEDAGALDVDPELDTALDVDPELDAALDGIPLDATPLEDGPWMGAPFTLHLETFAYTVRTGETVRVPIEVLRAPGFDAPVTLTADGLPDSIYAEPSFEVPERPESALVLEASGRAPLIDDAPFVISGTSMGHRREIRVTLDVIEGVTDW